MAAIVTGILCADCHFSHTVPSFRSGEESWYKAQGKVLREIRELVDTYKVPLICAGDLLDRWNSPPELINFLLDELPSLIYSVCGNHDLPYNSPGELSKSAYSTLVKAGRVVDLEAGSVLGLSEMVLHAFPWGSLLQPCKDRHDLDGRVHLAVVHKYVWKKGGAFPGAPPDGHYKKLLESLQEYDAILTGDNHVALHHNLDKSKEGPALYNPGGLMIRKSDEVNHKPSVGLLRSDGTITPYYLDTSEDVYLEKQESRSNLQAREFLDSLADLGGDDLDFREAVRNALREGKVSKLAKRITLKAIGE